MAQAEEITRIMDSKPMRMTRVANGHDMIDSKEDEARDDLQGRLELLGGEE